MDISCDRDDPGCVKDVVDGYTGSGNILICWEHDELTDIVKELGIKMPRIILMIGMYTDVDGWRN